MHAHKHICKYILYTCKKWDFEPWKSISNGPLRRITLLWRSTMGDTVTEGYEWNVCGLACMMEGGGLA